MVNETNEHTESLVHESVEEQYGPEYDSVADAPNNEGITVWINGTGADPAGYYSYANSQWSGPFGGPSNLPDVTQGGTTVESNAEILGFPDGYLTAAADPDTEKRVDVGVDIGTLDIRYHRNQTDSFDLSQPTSPSTDAPKTPTGWRFDGGSGSNSAEGGWFYETTPAEREQSSRSFGISSPSVTGPSGSSIKAGAWRIEREYEIGAPGQRIDLSAWALPTRQEGTYADGGNHSGETFVGEDDAYFVVRCFDSSLSEISLSDNGKYSETAVDQYFASVPNPDGANASDLDGSTWTKFTHGFTLPYNAAYVIIGIQTTDASDAWRSLGYTGGNAAIRVDEYGAEYPPGLRPTSIVEHTHDGRYIRDQSGAVSLDHLATDVATQDELDAHAGYGDTHHVRYSDAEAIDAVVGQSPLPVDITGNADTVDNIDANQFLRADKNESTPHKLSVGGGIEVNGTSPAASTDGEVGIGAPTVYTPIVESPDEGGGPSTYIEIGEQGPHLKNTDQIGMTTDGELQAWFSSDGLNMGQNDLLNTSRIDVSTIDSAPFAGEIDINDTVNFNSNPARHLNRIVPDETLTVHADRNPTPDYPIFLVESTGGAERLVVDHAGSVKTENQFIEVGFRMSGKGPAIIFGNGPEQIRRNSTGGLRAYDNANNATNII